MSDLGAELTKAFTGHQVVAIELHDGDERIVFRLDDGTTVSICGAGNDSENYLDIEVSAP